VSAWTTTIAGGAIAGAIAIPALAERADRARPLGPITVNFVNAPSWMTPHDLAPLEEMVRDQLDGSPFDRDGLRVAADGLRASGWFSSISQVRRSAIDAVEVLGHWTEPTALVRDADGDHLIDAEGRLLPRSYRHGAAPSFPRIEGNTSPRPSVTGARYEGGEVLAALALLAVIEDRPWRTQIAAVDVSHFRREGVLKLRTSRDATILWGRPPGDRSAAEVPTRQKISYLQFFYDRFGRIDAVGDGTLDVTGDYVGSRS